MAKRETVPQECKVSSVPPYVRAKITEFKAACEDNAFRGAQSPEAADVIEQTMWDAWYTLERTIATAIEAAVAKTENDK